MDEAGDDGERRAGTPDEERARLEQDVHEEPTSFPDPGGAGVRTTAALGAWWAVSFLLAVAVFFYSLGRC